MRKQMGYLLVDHSASPGLPEAVALAAGYDPKYCAEGKRFEADTLTCAHCKGPAIKSLVQKRGYFECMKCSGHYICDFCAMEASKPDYVHTPFEKLADDLREQAVLGSPPDLLLPAPAPALALPPDPAPNEGI